MVIINNIQPIIDSLNQIVQVSEVSPPLFDQTYRIKYETAADANSIAHQQALCYFFRCFGLDINIAGQESYKDKIVYKVLTIQAREDFTTFSQETVAMTAENYQKIYYLCQIKSLMSQYVSEFPLQLDIQINQQQLDLFITQHNLSQSRRDLLSIRYALLQLKIKHQIDTDERGISKIIIPQNQHFNASAMMCIPTQLKQHDEFQRLLLILDQYLKEFTYPTTDDMLNEMEETIKKISNRYHRTPPVLIAPAKLARLLSELKDKIINLEKYIPPHQPSSQVFYQAYYYLQFCNILEKLKQHFQSQQAYQEIIRILNNIRVHLATPIEDFDQAFHFIYLRLKQLEPRETQLKFANEFERVEKRLFEKQLKLLHSTLGLQYVQTYQQILQATTQQDAQHIVKEFELDFNQNRKNIYQAELKNLSKFRSVAAGSFKPPAFSEENFIYQLIMLQQERIAFLIGLFLALRGYLEKQMKRVSPFFLFSRKRKTFVETYKRLNKMMPLQDEYLEQNLLAEAQSIRDIAKQHRFTRNVNPEVTKTKSLTAFDHELEKYSHLFRR